MIHLKPFMYKTLEKNDQIYERISKYSAYAQSLAEKFSVKQTINPDKLKIKSTSEIKVVPVGYEKPEIKPVEKTAEAKPTPQTLEKIADPEPKLEPKPEIKPAPLEKAVKKEQPVSKEYVTLSELVKIPGVKSSSALRSYVLKDYKENHPDKYVKEDGCTSIKFELCETLFTHILKNPEKAKEVLQNWKNSVKETEQKVLDDLLNKIYNSDEVWLKLEELTTLPGIKSYVYLKNKAIEKYIKQNPETKRKVENENKQYVNEFKLTQELVEMIFEDEETKAFVLEAIKEKLEGPKTKTEPSKQIEDNEQDSVNTPLDELVEVSVEQIEVQEVIIVPPQITAPITYEKSEPQQVSKKQLRREREEQHKEEVRKYLVQKLCATSLHKIGRNKTDSNNLKKGLPGHLKGFVDDVIDEWVNQGYMFGKRKNAQFQVSLNHEKIRELQNKYQ